MPTVAKSSIAYKQTNNKKGCSIMKINKSVVFYHATDLSQYSSGQEYLHPTITIGISRLLDASDLYKSTGNEYYLKQSRTLFEATGSTLFIENGLLSREIELRWQTHRENIGGRLFYTSPYACLINRCGFDTESISLVGKLAKCASLGRETSPVQVVEALKKLKAVCVVWNRDADSFVITDHLQDNLFGLPDHLRQPKRAPAGDEVDLHDAVASVVNGAQ